MEINAYRIVADSVEALNGPEDFLEEWRLGKDCFWVDIHSYKTDELVSWLGNLGLSALAMKCCREVGQTTRFVPLSREVFFAFPIYSEGVESEIVHLSFLCLKSVVVTLHADPLPMVEGVIAGLNSGLTIKEPSVSALVCLLLLLESAKSLKISEVLKKRVLELDDRMDQDPGSVQADDILDRKRSVRTLDAVVDAQRCCFAFMEGANRSFLDLKTFGTLFQMVPGNARAADQNVDRLEKTIADIRQRFEMNQQEKTNHRLAILTILSAIFMPLTLISGIYGMNFDLMPELHFPYSYPIALIVMASIAVGMYRYFKSRGWFE